MRFRTGLAALCVAGLPAAQGDYIRVKAFLDFILHAHPVSRGHSDGTLIQWPEEEDFKKGPTYEYRLDVRGGCQASLLDGRVYFGTSGTEAVNLKAQPGVFAQHKAIAALSVLDLKPGAISPINLANKFPTVVKEGGPGLYEYQLYPADQIYQHTFLFATDENSLVQALKKLDGGSKAWPDKPDRSHQYNAFQRFCKLQDLRYLNQPENVEVFAPRLEGIILEMQDLPVAQLLYEQWKLANKPKYDENLLVASKDGMETLTRSLYGTTLQIPITQKYHDFVEGALGKGHARIPEAVWADFKADTNTWGKRQYADMLHVDSHQLLNCKTPADKTSIIKVADLMGNFAADNNGAAILKETILPELYRDPYPSPSQVLFAFDFLTWCDNINLCLSLPGAALSETNKDELRQAFRTPVEGVILESFITLLSDKRTTSADEMNRMTELRVSAQKLRAEADRLQMLMETGSNVHAHGQKGSLNP